MSFLDYFRSQKRDTSKTAKERLQIIIISDRKNRQAEPDYLPQLKEDILEVLKKYVQVSPEHVNVQLERKDDEISMLELNIALPEDQQR